MADGHQHTRRAKIREATDGSVEAHGLAKSGARGYQAGQHPRGPRIRFTEARRLRVRVLFRLSMLQWRHSPFFLPSFFFLLSTVFCFVCLVLVEREILSTYFYL